MSQGVWVLVAVVVLATAFGAWRLLSDGRFRGTHRVRDDAVPSTTQLSTAPDAEPSPEGPGSKGIEGLEGLGDLGERATLLQFSSAFCAPCRTTRRVLTEVVDVVPGVSHVEVDAEHHLELVRRLGISRTPTTLVLDAAGREVARASGAPKRDEVLTTLARVLAG